jgi:hypothetical protein
MDRTAAAAIRDAAQRPALLSYVRERRCVLFVGAGLWRGAGYPPPSFSSRCRPTPEARG